MEHGCESSTDCRAARQPTGGRATHSALPAYADLIATHARRSRHGLGRAHALEAAAALLLLILFAPLMIVVAAALIACGRHPVFRQKRVGWRQAEFTILKFQTLCPDRGATAPQRPASRLQRAQDHAFAGLSHLLRQSRLDELPQLVNIVKGDMAFIGPRPLIPTDVTEMPAWRARRFEVHPGLTGLAQVSGGQALGPAEKLLLDLRYIETRSHRLNAWILGRTCLVPFQQDRPRAEPQRTLIDATRNDVTAPHEPCR
jgi:lipopolysaccharide/colanic/teichoic acid biosynthesis glycosyltransferase